MTDRDELVELLPCPFCGGDAVREDIPADDTNNENAGASYITCKTCWASTRLEFGRKENLRSAWNTRAALSATPLAQMRDALEEIINPIAAMQARLKEGEMLDGNMAHMLAKDPEYLRSIARAALTGEAP